MHKTVGDSISVSSAEKVSAPRLGIIGGGQLARMTAMAAFQLGFDVVVLDRNADSPAAMLATRSLVGDWAQQAPLLDLAAQVNVVTLENEFIDAELLQVLERHGHTVLPTAHTMALVQDKFIQKQTLQSASLPIPRMAAVENLDAFRRAVVEFGIPLLLKARRNAYDGKGNATIRCETDIEAAWQRLGGNDGNPLFVEAFCDFTKELAIIITRGRNGETATYPVVETVQRNHICHIVRAPAQVAPDVVAQAEDVARRAIEAVGAVGSFGVEMFLTPDGKILVNELAPRVHNSGHYTLEGCVCSQFENHVRAVLGLPLGSTKMVAPAAVMVNLLGTQTAAGHPAGMERALAVPGAHVHLYGKSKSSAGRKMGHVTALGDTIENAELTATRCAAEIRFEINS